MQRALVSGALWVSMMTLPLTARAQVLGRASSAVHGSSGQGSGSSDRSSSEGGAGGSSGGSSGGSFGGSSGGSSRGSRDDSAAPRTAMKCPKDQSIIECLRDRWEEAGLGDLGGALFFWATVLGDYPYADDSGGYAVPSRDDEGVEREERTAFRLGLETGYVLAGAGRMAASARVQLPFFIDLATRYSLYYEPVVDTIAVALIGRVDFEVRVIDANGLQLRIGGGLRHFHDTIGSVLGGGLNIAMDVFPVEPLVLSFSADAGAVGRALLVSLRASVGVLFGATELFAGYHYEGLLGDTEADLGGVMLGMRQWL